jgi:hypothetical protein
LFAQNLPVFLDSELLNDTFSVNLKNKQQINVFLTQKIIPRYLKAKNGYRKPPLSQSFPLPPKSHNSLSLPHEKTLQRHWSLLPCGALHG